MTPLFTENYTLQCENTIDGLLTAIYDAFVIKKQLTPYKDTISITTVTDATPDFFSKWITVETDPRKAALTASTIINRLGHMVYNSVFNSLCHYDTERGTYILGFLVRAFQSGPSTLNNLADPYVMRILEYTRKASNEAHFYREIVRFTQISNILYSKIAPKCHVLPYISDHFADRFPNENWIIYDETHQLGSIHKSGQSWYLFSHPDLDLSNHSPKPLATEHFESGSTTDNSIQLHDEYPHLWKVFFQTIGIEQRYNPRCQNTLLPKHYRKYMDEFQNN